MYQDHPLIAGRRRWTLQAAHQRYTPKPAAVTLALALLGLACGDDSTAATASADDSGTTAIAESSGSTGTSPTTTIDETGSGSADTSGTTTTADTSGTATDATTTDTDSTTDTDGTTGDPVLPGRTQSQLVGVGERMSSATYQMVFTLGQPTQHQSTHTSPNFRLQGGLVGANGSPP